MNIDGQDGNNTPCFICSSDERSPCVASAFSFDRLLPYEAVIRPPSAKTANKLRQHRSLFGEQRKYGVMRSDRRSGIPGNRGNNCRFSSGSRNNDVLSLCCSVVFTRNAVCDRSCAVNQHDGGVGERFPVGCWLILLPRFNAVFSDRRAKLQYGYGNLVTSIDLWHLLRVAVDETRVGQVQWLSSIPHLPRIEQCRQW